MNQNDDEPKPRPTWWKSLFGDKKPPLIESRETLVEEIRRAQNKGLIASTALRMMEGVMQVDNLQARDIMLARSQIQFIQRDSSYRDILTKVMNSGHSRYPVMDENKDDIEGILHAKDLLKYIGRENEFDIDDILRPAIFAPESQRLNKLLANFKKSRNHIAVIVDEYSGISGLVTIEDILEQIVGEIDDEHDIEEKPNIQSRRNNRFTVNALTPIDEFNDYFSGTLPTHQFDTIGGLVTHQIGKIPQQGEKLLTDDFDFLVLSSDGRRIQLLEVEPLLKEAIKDKQVA